MTTPAEEYDLRHNDLPEDRTTLHSNQELLLNTIDHLRAELADSKSTEQILIRDIEKLAYDKNQLKEFAIGLEDELAARDARIVYLENELDLYRTR